MRACLLIMSAFVASTAVAMSPFIRRTVSCFRFDGLTLLLVFFLVSSDSVGSWALFPGIVGVRYLLLECAHLFVAVVSFVLLSNSSFVFS